MQKEQEEKDRKKAAETKLRSIAKCTGRTINLAEDVLMPNVLANCKKIATENLI
jgi:hypothetical protein